MALEEKIRAQQKGHENEDIFTVGQQLLDICRDPACAAIVEEDLANEAMDLKAAARKIKAWADARREETKAGCICVPPDVSDRILREFYGLPQLGQASAPMPVVDDLPDFEAFLA